MNNINKKCGSCGGNLMFSPLSQNLVCEKCGNQTSIESSNNVVKHNIDSNFDNIGTNDKFVNITYSCQNCGANLKSNNLNYSTKCAYCGSNSIIADFSKSDIYPDAIIPFEIDKSKIYETFKQNVKHKPFLPNAFKKSFNIDNAQSFYFPSFCFDANTSSSYKGTLYYTTTDNEGHSHTHYFNIKGNKDVTIKNLSIESSSILTQSQLEGIKPFDFSKAKTFNADYLRGFETEYHDCSLQSCYKLSKPYIKEIIKNQILSKYSYSGVDSLNINTQYFNEKYFYCLLPAYKISCNYKEKNYNTIMNGQTGKIDGKLPKSKVKIFFTALLVIIFLFLVFVLPIILD